MDATQFFTERMLEAYYLPDRERTKFLRGLVTSIREAQHGAPQEAEGFESQLRSALDEALPRMGHEGFKDTVTEFLDLLDASIH